MKQWEDIVKDKLEGYESPLPEGSLAEFRALRDGKAAPAKKVAPWIWGVAVAVAAGLAVVLFLHHPEVSEVHYIIAQPVASINRPSQVAQVTPLEAPRQKTLKNIPKKYPVDSQGETQVQATDDQVDASETIDNCSADSSVENITKAESSSITIAIPHEETIRVSMPSWMVPAVGGLAGASTLTALASNFAKKETPVEKMGKNMRDELAEWSRPGRIGQGGSIPYKPIIPERDSVSSFKHYIPVKEGVSARIPVGEQFFITTGLDYTLYTSRFTFTLSGKKTQYAHYLGVPVLLDWVFASGKVLDVYVGCGLQGDLCVGATLAGNQLKKDGFSLYLLGSGGLQLNASKRLGFYLEPQLSWPFYTANKTLVTYRSEHPVVFSVAAGIRINLGQ